LFKKKRANGLKRSTFAVTRGFRGTGRGPGTLMQHQQAFRYDLRMRNSPNKKSEMRYAEKHQQQMALIQGSKMVKLQQQEQ
jgi:hypothetical protein